MVTPKFFLFISFEYDVLETLLSLIKFLINSYFNIRELKQITAVSHRSEFFTHNKSWIYCCQYLELNCVFYIICKRLTSNSSDNRDLFIAWQVAATLPQSSKYRPFLDNTHQRTMNQGLGTIDWCLGEQYCNALSD